MSQNDKNMIAATQESFSAEKEIGVTITEVFMKANEALHDLKDYIADEYAATNDTEILPELDASNWLIGDAIEIVERAKMRAEGTLKGKQTARVFLTTMGEYFTFDPTTPKLRYTGIPKEYRH